MNTKTKRRMVAVTGVIVIVLIVVLAVVGGNSAAKTVTVSEAVALQGDNKIQVTGNVAENSFDIEGDTLTFQIYDAESDPAASQLLDVRYDGGVSATFGNDVTAICSGKKGADGVLVCSELVTKCPSKYENAEGSLSVADLLGYGDAVIDKPVKVSGVIETGTLAGVNASRRFVLEDESGDARVAVKYDGALSDEMGEGTRVVLTGSLGANGSFTATVVALEG